VAIFNIWLDMPVWGIFGSLAGLFSALGLLIHGLCFSERMRPRSSTFAGVVAPFFGSVAILFSLLTGFLANEVWERNRQAGRAIMAERDGLLAVHAISLAAASDMREIRIAVQDYAKALVDDEWPRMMDQEGSVKAGQELLNLLTLVSNPKVSTDAGQAAQGALLDTVLKLRSTRIILGLITQVAIAIVHLEKPKAQAAALTIFSVAAVITLGLVAVRERPFDGPLRFSPEPVQEALQVMAGPADP
jgi:hypothetical protein